MQNTGICLAAFSFLVLAPLSPATAETGPCQPDNAGVVICGQGPGAARVVEGTTSPSKQLAFAWRVPGRSPTEPPPSTPIRGQQDERLIVESLLIRLSDGVVLSSAPGMYWRTGDLQANNIDEIAAWSPNSRFVIEATNSKWSTDILRLYAIQANDKVLILDLQKIVEPAVRKRLRQLGKNDSAYTFTVDDADGGEARLKIDDSGRVQVPVLMQIPKQDPYANFDVTLQVSQKNETLMAGDLSVQRARTK